MPGSRWIRDRRRPYQDNRRRYNRPYYQNYRYSDYNPEIFGDHTENDLQFSYPRNENTEPSNEDGSTVPNTSNAPQPSSSQTVNSNQRRKFLRANKKNKSQQKNQGANKNLQGSDINPKGANKNLQSAEKNPQVANKNIPAANRNPQPPVLNRNSQTGNNTQTVTNSQVANTNSQSASPHGASSLLTNRNHTAGSTCNTTSGYSIITTPVTYQTPQDRNPQMMNSTTQPTNAANTNQPVNNASKTQATKSTSYVPILPMPGGAVQIAANANSLGLKRRTGGRGREWVNWCHRLIEAMLELEESKPFRDPVSELQFPDYYSCVENHMDLSRVMMNLHNNLYDNPYDFDEDIKLIFENWKKYLKDPSSPIVEQLYKISWWYTREFSKMTPDLLQKTPYRNISPTKRVRLNSSPGSAGSSKATPSVAEGTVRKPPANRFSWTVLSSSLAQDATNQPRTPTQAVTTAPLVTPKTATVTAVQAVQRPAMTQVAARSKPIAPRPAASQPVAATASSISNLDILAMSLDVTNIWLGATRVKPARQVQLTEDGMHIYLSSSASEDELTFTIPAKEIVRAVGHLSKSKKHSLFLFVTPAVEKTMRIVLQTHNSPRNRLECFSLVTIFVKALSKPQISKLMHIFYNIGRKSIFGQLWSEVDQAGALSILASIKPNILSRVLERSDRDSQANETLNSSNMNSAQPVRSVAPRGRRSSANTAAASTSLHPGTTSQPVDSCSAITTHSASPDAGNSLQVINGSSESNEETNGSSVDDTDLQILDPMEVEDAAEEAMLLADEEEDLVMMKTCLSTKCPITQLTMSAPVRNKHCGHSYDKQGVEQLIINRGKKAKCPVPGCSNDTPLNMEDMETDQEVQEVLRKAK